MNPMRTLSVCSTLVLVAACGGSDLASPSTSQFVNAAPTYSQVAIEVEAGDATPPAAVNSVDGQDLAAPAAADCHPHLFSRTHEIAARLNAHANKMIHHVVDAVQDNPTLTSGQQKQWTRTLADGSVRRVTITANSDGSFTTTVELAPAAAPTAFVTIATSTVTMTAANASATPPVLAEEKGTIAFDYDKLHSVYANERATGQFTATFDVVKDPSKGGAGRKKSVTLAFTNFLPEGGDPHGPRTGTFTHVGYPGLGGTLSFADTLILLCPANPSGATAETTTEARWYKAADGVIHGRADAKAVGSAGSAQIPAGQTWLGVTCHSGNSTARADESGYWMMKLEDATLTPPNNTVRGSAFENANKATAPACDAALGAKVPDLSDNTNDWTFGAALSFPGAW